MKKLLAIIMVVLMLVSGCQKVKEDIVESEASGDVVVTEANNELEDEEVPFVVEPESLRAKAVEKGVYVGAAISIGDFGFEIFLNTLMNEYSMVTTENLMKWDRMNSYERGKFNYAGPDIIRQFVQDHDMKMRGHAIVWHDSMPDWLMGTEWTKAELTEILEEYIEAVMGHFKGDIYAWDVLNEIISDENGAMRDTMWYRILGDDLPVIALTKARAVDPDAKLIINDYSVEEINVKSNALYDLCQRLLDAGVPLDGVGFQSHLVSGHIDFDSMAENIERFQALGLEVQFTEIDIRVQSPFTEEKMAVQKEDYKQLMTMALDHDIDTFVLWGVSDTQSWIPMWFQDYGSALIFDNVYEPKVGYYGLLEALEDHE